MYGKEFFKKCGGIVIQAIVLEVVVELWSLSITMINTSENASSI